MAVEMINKISMVKYDPMPAENRSVDVNTAGMEAGKDENNGERRLVSEDQYIKNLELVNRRLIGPDTRLEFSVHKGTHEIIVKVINEDTDEVIKEIPPEKILDLVAKIWEIVGLFVDKHV